MQLVRKTEDRLLLPSAEASSYSTFSSERRCKGDWLDTWGRSRRKIHGAKTSQRTGRLEFLK